MKKTAITRAKWEGGYDYDPYQLAKDYGLKVVLPAENELQLDIDTPEQMAQYEAQLPLLRNFMMVRETKRTKSFSGNDHIYLACPGLTFTPSERIALQAALGSDPKRELLSMARAKFSNKPATLFFEVDESK